MDNMLNYIAENKQWLFSGLGIVLLGWIIKFIFFRNKPTQVQKSGKDSISIQAGGDVNIGDAKWMDKNKK